LISNVLCVGEGVALFRGAADKLHGDDQRRQYLVRTVLAQDALHALHLAPKVIGSVCADLHFLFICLGLISAAAAAAVLQFVLNKHGPGVLACVLFFTFGHHDQFRGERCNSSAGSICGSSSSWWY
jgi:hypothetical protein